MKHILTFDIEDWYHTSDFKIDPNQWDKYEVRVVDNTLNILDELDKHNVKATFFILGYVAEKKPELVFEIIKRGHEIGSHGYYHKLIDEMTREEFEMDLKKSLKVLREISNSQIKYYRAPAWSINKTNLWVFDILEKYNIICDSSTQPFKTHMSGDGSLPTTAYIPVLDGEKKSIIEFPSSTIKIFKINIPFAGGAYLRAIPYFIFKTIFKSVSKKQPIMVYVHPWEVDENPPKIKSRLFVHITHYINIKSTYKKLNWLLENFEFSTLGEFIEHNNFEYKKI